MGEEGQLLPIVSSQDTLRRKHRYVGHDGVVAVAKRCAGRNPAAQQFVLVGIGIETPAARVR